MKYFALFVLALYFNGTAAQNQTTQKELDAELIILPPLILGYEDLADSDRDSNDANNDTVDAAPSNETVNSRIKGLRELNQNIGGNFALPNVLAARMSQMDDTNKLFMANNLAQLLQLSMLGATPSMDATKRRQSVDVETSPVGVGQLDWNLS